MQNEKHTSLNEYNFKTEHLYLNKYTYKPEPLKKKIEGRDYHFFKIDEITYEDEEKFPRKEALENFIGAMNVGGMNFVYLILGNRQGVNFYYGVAKDLTDTKGSIDAHDSAREVLQPSLQGNFRGSKISFVEPSEKKRITDQLNAYKNISMLEGCPSVNKDDDKYQTVDRLVDVMVGEEFALMIIFKQIDTDGIDTIKDKTYEYYNTLVPLSKISSQDQESKNESTTKTEGASYQKTTGKSKGYSQGTSDSTSTSSGKKNTNKGGSESSSSGSQESESNGENTSIAKQDGISTTTSKSSEIVEKKWQSIIKYIDDIVLQRIDYGIGKGLYLASTVLMGNHPTTILRLENTLRSVYGSEVGNLMPMKSFTISDEVKKLLCNFQIPVIKYNNITKQEIQERNISFQYFIDDSTTYLANWMTSKELSLVAGVPQREVIGLTLKTEVEFGLNVKNVKEDIFMGHLVQSGNVCINKDDEEINSSLPDVPVYLNADDINSHIFITGTTGSGKTTTCQKILLSENYNGFMVIEPAKTEYRVLKDNFKDILIFTLGKESAAPFRMNPFEFFRNESITSRIDMLRACFEASFDMEAAIPQILESAMYGIYKEKGWDIATNKNENYEDPFAPNVKAFPTLSDLKESIVKNVESYGFTERLKDEYIGSIKARIEGLMVGAKGFMLDTPRSLNFTDLLEKKVIFELENLKSSSDKSLIMGLILSNLNEALKEQYEKKGGKFKHITLIEEAHRLLSKYEYGDSQNKKHGVEIFTDMLAEVRKYGEGLVIVDQIPNKLTPEVLKNTNTKIVHKIFADDDKNAVGNIMALTKEQKEHLSYLVAGRTVMLHPGLEQPIQVQIHQDKANNTARIPPKDEELRPLILEYYAENYKDGVLWLENLQSKPSIEFISRWMETQRNFRTVLSNFARINFPQKNDEKDREKLENYLKDYKKSLGSIEEFATIFTTDKNWIKKLSECFNKILSDKNYIIEERKLKDYMKNIGTYKEVK